MVLHTERLGSWALCAFVAVCFTGGCEATTGNRASADTDIEPRDFDLVSPLRINRIPAPLPSAYCSIDVIGQREYDIETDYLPRVVWCENGGADFEALKAQAIAARSVAYYEAALDGSICDSQSCQAASCEGSAAATLAVVPDEVFRAVEETSGTYLMYDATLTYGFYVAGSSSFSGGCVGVSGGAPTEKWVTYNNGKDGVSVEQTGLGSRFDPSDKEYGQNRGCMSQWGARCLEEQGNDAIDILRYYYGEDIELVQAQGDCVDPDQRPDDDDDDDDDDTDGVEPSCGDGVCDRSEDEGACPEDCTETCGSIGTERPTIIDETSACFERSGEEQYFHEDDVGYGDSLLWTETTANVAHTSGEWRFNFERGGEYSLEIYVEGDYANETRARYRITHDGEESYERIDQSQAHGWVDLGSFQFEAGARDQALRLIDISGERGNKLLFDAVRVVPQNIEAPDKEDEDGEAVGDLSRGGAQQGCAVGTRSSGGPTPLGLAWVMLAMLGRLRRRRIRQSS